MIDDDSTDPGPHTCVYGQADDVGDRCEVCDKIETCDEWSYWNWRDSELGPEWDVSDVEEPLGIQLPDYDYQGGG